ncbi:helix-turn-helix domain-containing protein [Klebsiella grimontii]|uniref:helix-turn-helix domain-containing protein n=1 Tax=Klebsiella grimontii TaxID=2058152 RepID=UPI00273E1208|nr:helix-turn-helix domain-containing protein [Klebsiella grimontii]
MMSLWDALRMNMMISYQELVRTFPKVVAMRAEGRSYRWIARELGISKNTVADIVQRHRANA